jgi:RNase P/RNase MRP subunit p29
MKTTPFRFAVLALLASGVLILSGCGPSTPTTATGGATPGANRQGGGQNARFPGVSGLIVAVSGKTLQVRTNSGQSAVSYTSKTPITQEQKANVSAAKVGLCAVVRTAAAASSAAPSSTITAESVSLSAATNGTCQGGFGGGQRPGGGRTAFPSGAPSAGQPSGGPSGGANGRRGGGGFGANGKIISVTGQTMVIEASQPGSTETVKTSVALTSTTTYAEQAKATAKAVTTGKCVFATGTADTTGATKATALRLSPATNGSCTTGLGQGRPGGGQSGG